MTGRSFSKYDRREKYFESSFKTFELFPNGGFG